MITPEQLVDMSATQALEEIGWDEIHKICRPTTVFEHLLRIDFERMQQTFIDMRPHLGIRPAIVGFKALKLERFYRQAMELKDR